MATEPTIFRFQTEIWRQIWIENFGDCYINEAVLAKFLLRMRKIRHFYVLWRPGNWTQYLNSVHTVSYKKETFGDRDITKAILAQFPLWMHKIHCRKSYAQSDSAHRDPMLY